MVKGYDPTQSDVSAFLLNYLFQLRNKDPKIDLNYAEKLVRRWLNTSSYTSKIYQSFSQLGLRPRIKLRRKCGVSKQKIKDQPDEYFPTKSKENEVILCLDNIRNKLELKQHLDRQITFCYLQKSSFKAEDSIEKREKKLMHNIYQSCYRGYKNYMLDDKATKELAINCSKYLFFRKTKSDLPLDRLFRYATQLSEEIL